jgi:hypothetical protein
MSNPPRPATPDDHGDRTENEPFNVWWPKYIALVDDSVKAAEKYLAVPAGTISSISQDPDYIATVKTYAVIEPMLNDLITAKPPRTSFGSVTPVEQMESYSEFVARLNISGRTGKLALAKGLGLLDQHQVRFVESVARIRNRYAHNVRNMHRSLIEILTEEQHGNAKVVEDVTGLSVKLPTILAPHLKMFMYHRLSDYLADALKTLKPPPLPTGGLLAGLFGATDLKIENLGKPDAAKMK